MNYEKLRQNDKQFLALTSFTVKEFDELLLHFSKSWYKYNKTYLYNGEIRLNKPPKKGRGKLPTDGHKLFFILYSYKNNPIQEALAASFEMQQSQASLWITKIEALLHDALQEGDFTPIRDIQVFHDYLAEHQQEEDQHLLLDATERPIPRSTDHEAQKAYYSGKKRTYCKK